MYLTTLTGDTRRMVDGSDFGRLKNTTDRIDGTELKDRRDAVNCDASARDLHG
jgi:hypothetical protein